MHLQFNVLGLESGIVIGNQLPPKNSEEGYLVYQAIGQAIHEANINKIDGENISNYVRERFNALTEQLNFPGNMLWEGSSTNFNFQLIKSNIELGCQVAKDLNSFTKNVFGNWDTDDIVRPDTTQRDNPDTNQEEGQTTIPSITINEKQNI